MSLLESRTNNGATMTQCQGLSFPIFPICVTDLGPFFVFALSPLSPFAGQGQPFYLLPAGTHFKAIIHTFGRSKMRSIPIYLLFNRLFSNLPLFFTSHLFLLGSLLLMRNAHFSSITIEKKKQKPLKWVIYLPLR